MRKRATPWHRPSPNFIEGAMYILRIFPIDPPHNSKHRHWSCFTDRVLSMRHGFLIGDECLQFGIAAALPVRRSLFMSTSSSLLQAYIWTSNISIHCRFSCVSREYMYLFWRGAKDISAMQKAAQRFIGEHDFRNFCKMDAVNVSNYRRHITEISISPCNKWPNDGDKLWAITIKGSAFLWHQVRCMVSVLFMIGEGLESQNIIDVLLDINEIPRKPQYNMASELPLMLHCCEFQDVNFICSSDARQNLEEHFSNELRTCLLRAAIIDEALHCLQTTGVEEATMEHRKKKKGHISLMLRPTEPSYEERRAKWAKKAAACAES